MTAKRLEELKKKFNSNSGNMQDLGELLTDLFQSFSSHMKELKGQIKEVEANQEIIFAHLEEIKQEMNPIYTIIQPED